MDDETRAYLDGIRVSLDGMMRQINNQFERILDALKAVREDTNSTRGHVLYGLQENLTLSQRISKIEQELRRR